MRSENFLPYLTGQRKLRPRPGDLSFANLTSRRARLASSDQWTVLTQECGQPAITFQHRQTGTTISSRAITEPDLAGLAGWARAETGDKRIRIMFYDEDLTKP